MGYNIQGTNLEHHDSPDAWNPHVTSPRLWVKPDYMILNVVRNEDLSGSGKRARFGISLLGSPSEPTIKELPVTLVHDLFPVVSLVLK